MLCSIAAMEPNQSPARLAAASEAVASFSPAPLRARIDGWTPEKQQLFCETLADCGLVRDAAAAVGMSPQSAYALRRRAEGRAFGLAWNAALYLARHRLMDLAIERAMEGNVVSVTKDGEVIGERKQQDMRHLLAAITKLEGVGFADRATRTVADEFDLFLDAMEADANRAVALPGHEAAVALRTIEAAQFFETRQPNGRISHHELDNAANRMRRGQGVAPLASVHAPFNPADQDGHRMIDSLTQDDLDAWDEFERWEAEERASRGSATPVRQCKAV